MIKRVICLIGPGGSGKGTAAKFLEERGYTAFSLSGIIREKAQVADIFLSTGNIQILGDQLRAKHGDNYLAKEVIKRAKGDLCQNIVIDGPRNSAEVECIRSEFLNSLLIYIDTADSIRKKRINQRKRVGDPTTSGELSQVMEKDLSSVYQLSRMHGIIVLDNNGTLERFYKRLLEILNENEYNIPEVK